MLTNVAEFFSFFAEPVALCFVWERFAVSAAEPRQLGIDAEGVSVDDTIASGQE